MMSFDTLSDHQQVFIVGAILGLLPAAIAYRKGRRFLPWWIFGSLLFIVALPIAIFLKADQGVTDGRSAINLLALALLIAGVGIWWMFFYDRGFTDEEIAAFKDQIKTEFEKRPETKVTEVYLMREDDKHLKGFAKVKVNEFDFSKNCTVTKGEDGSMWSCE